MDCKKSTCPVCFCEDHFNHEKKLLNEAFAESKLNIEPHLNDFKDKNQHYENVLREKTKEANKKID